MWQNPETTNVQRRTIRMAPPGWKPFVYPAAQPPVQYPDYHAERQADIGRGKCVPRILVRLDASKSNYSSARLDTGIFRITAAGIQNWFSGTERSQGTLNRLHEEVIKEARFSVPELRRRPSEVLRVWTWPTIPLIDSLKESQAEDTSLRSRTLSWTDALASRGTNPETQVRQMKRERQLLVDAGLPLPAFMLDVPAGVAAAPVPADPNADPNADDKQEAVNAQAK